MISSSTWYWIYKSFGWGGVLPNTWQIGTTNRWNLRWLSARYDLGCFLRVAINMNGWNFGTLKPRKEMQLQSGLAIAKFHTRCHRLQWALQLQGKLYQSLCFDFRSQPPKDTTIHIIQNHAGAKPEASVDGQEHSAVPMHSQLAISMRVSKRNVRISVQCQPLWK